MISDLLSWEVSSTLTESSDNPAIHWETNTESSTQISSFVYMLLHHFTVGPENIILFLLYSYRTQFCVFLYNISLLYTLKYHSYLYILYRRIHTRKHLWYINSLKWAPLQLTTAVKSWFYINAWSYLSNDIIYNTITVTGDIFNHIFLLILFTQVTFSIL